MSIHIQLQTMAFMALCGVLMGMGFDTYHVFKNKGRFPLWVVFILDILFWLTSIGVVFYVLVVVNGGIVRFPIYFGLIIGAWIYFLLVSKTYIQFLLAVIKWAIRIMNFSVKVIDMLLVRPLELIFRFFWISLVFLFSFVVKFLVVLWKIITFPMSPFVRWGRKLWKRIEPKIAGLKGIVKKWISKSKKT
ncbi:spore cortex biosynthesis protein YabQ [Brevibacillus daliensis]|uniref:spore cortex biosynthesis protein YabQ n=1 Tax=Brevibacillus daliensis TaxID=2892995 RepID=UPI001E286C2F|nr:spore cortex biosynthesis protein YabQ [Brevibacillus daliensis]